MAAVWFVDSFDESSAKAGYAGDAASLIGGQGPIETSTTAGRIRSGTKAEVGGTLSCLMQEEEAHVNN